MACVPKGGAAPVDWNYVTVQDRGRAITATLTYENASLHGSPGKAYRNLTLRVRRNGKLLISYKFRGHSDRSGGVIGFDRPQLELRNIWGDREPEAIVHLTTGGQNCCSIAIIGVTTRVRGRVLVHNFGRGWTGQWYQGRFEFISNDDRFSCFLVSCADSVDPLRVFALDGRTGEYVDVTGTRQQALEEQAGSIWHAYLRSRKRPDDLTKGQIIAWCADQYLLKRRQRCDHALRQAILHRYLGPGVQRNFIDAVHNRLIALGYG